MGITEQKRQLTDMLDRLKRAGVNTVLLQTRVRATTIYPSQLESWDVCMSGKAGRSPGYDALQFAIDECHRRGMELHAWVVTIPIGKWTTYGCQQLRKRYPSLVKKIGDEGYMNPELSGTADYLTNICEEITSRYDIDGIHLDYIRYGTTPETPTAAERARFEAAMKKKAVRWPADVMPDGKLRADYLAYRRYAVGGTVKTLRERLRAAAPKVRLSAAVYGAAAKARDNVGQDWIAWLSNDYLDWALPMNYAATDAAFVTILDAQKCPASVRRRIVSGIGITAAECDLSAAEALRQIEIVRKRGYGGYALFDLDAKLLDEILPVLAP
jgi:uncharacterized lipoprotein YddW (UPF0748 family)